jgi:hypothetical protein
MRVLQGVVGIEILRDHIAVGEGEGGQRAGDSIYFCSGITFIVDIKEIE